jgi:histone H3/H4
VVPFKRLIKRRLAPMVKKIGRHERVSLKLVENLDKVLTEIAR